MLERAFRLNPIPTLDFYISLAWAYRENGQYEKAIEVCEKAISGNPDYMHGYLTLAASYSSLNRSGEARKAVEKILRIHPPFTLERHSNTLPFKNQEKLKEYINALGKAGLPE